MAVIEKCKSMFTGEVPCRGLRFGLNICKTVKLTVVVLAVFSLIIAALRLIESLDAESCG